MSQINNEQDYILYMYRVTVEQSDMKEAAKWFEKLDKGKQQSLINNIYDDHPFYCFFQYLKQPTDEQKIKALKAASNLKHIDFNNLSPELKDNILDMIRTRPTIIDNIEEPSMDFIVEGASNHYIYTNDEFPIYDPIGYLKRLESRIEHPDLIYEVLKVKPDIFLKNVDTAKYFILDNKFLENIETIIEIIAQDEEMYNNANTVINLSRFIAQDKENNLYDTNKKEQYNLALTDQIQSKMLNYKNSNNSYRIMPNKS